MGRPPHPLLSRDRIVSTALALADSEGLDAVSTRPAPLGRGCERAGGLRRHHDARRGATRSLGIKGFTACRVT